MRDKKTIALIRTKEIQTHSTEVVSELKASYQELYTQLRKHTHSLAPGTPIDLFLWIISNLTETNKFTIGSSTFRAYNESIPRQMSERHFYRLVATLTEAKLITKVGFGDYELNPEAIFAGEQKMQSFTLPEKKKEYAQFKTPETKPTLYSDSPEHASFIANHGVIENITIDDTPHDHSSRPVKIIEDYEVQEQPKSNIYGGLNI